MAELKLEKQIEPGKLRIYIGAAPGVGKTFLMLRDAHLLKEQGIDIVIGLVETHGRKETLAQVGDLEQVPLKVIPYRSVELKEMDVDAVIARHPHTVIVDELAHTNVVVNVDVTVDELRSRLRQGKIYAADKVEQSLANFFRKGNLNLLRELSLRVTAEQVGSRAAEYRRVQGLEQALVPEKVMVCLSDRAGNEKLVRVGARIAGRLASDWFVVYVARPQRDHGHGDPAAYDRLQSVQRMARELGAKIVVLEDKNVSDALIRFAQQESISHDVFGQSVRSRRDILLRGSVLNRFLNEVRDVTVQVVPMQRDLRRI